VKKASDGELNGVLGYTDEQVVSTDFLTSSFSSIFDAGAGISLNEHFVKLVTWSVREYQRDGRLLTPAFSDAPLYPALFLVSVFLPYFALKILKVHQLVKHSQYYACYKISVCDEHLFTESLKPLHDI